MAQAWRRHTVGSGGGGAPIRHDRRRRRTCLTVYSIVTIVLSCIISDIKRDICRKSWFFHTPLHLTPPLGGLRRNIAIQLVWKHWNGGDIRWWKNFEDTYNRLDRISACDRRTDRWTSCHGIVRAMNTRRAVKIETIIQQRRSRWLWHIYNIDETRIAKWALEWLPESFTRKPGRLKKNW